LKERAMDDSDFNDSDGDIDYDLLHDLHLENQYDDGPFAAFAPFVDLNHVGYHRGDIDYYPNIDGFGGALPADSDGYDDADGLGEEQHGLLYDVSDTNSSSEGSDTEEEEVVVHGEQYRPQAPFGAEARAANDSGSDSESEDEYPADEDFEEAVEAIEHAHRHILHPHHQVRPAQQEDGYGWDFEDGIDVDEVGLDGDDNLSDRIPYLPFGIDSDLSESESESESDIDDGASDDEASSSALEDSPPLSPAAPPSASNLFERFAAPEFHLIRADYNRLEEDRGRLEEHIRQIRGARLPFGSGHAAAQPAIANRLAQREAQQLLAEIEMDAEISRRLERQNRRIMDRFGAEALQPPASGTSSRRRTHAQAFGTPAAPPAHQPRPLPTVIDLTDEPDSPPRQAIALPNAPRFTAAAAGGRRQPQSPPQAQPQAQRHSRRRQGGMQRTPSLARSDGSLLGPRRAGAEVGLGPGGPTVIDLTEDGPEVAAAPPPRPASAAAGHMPPPAPFWRAAIQPPTIENVFRQMHRHVGHLVAGPHDFLDRLRVGWAGGETPELEVQFLGELPRLDNGGPLPGVAGLFGNRFDNPLANNHPGHLNYAGNGFGREAEREKPVHIPPPAPRQGFTRTTGDDIVAICVSCENELQYDPDDKDEPPAKKVKTRKDREEHHFWAVKSCGHVSHGQLL
jgi:hypothetical protein